MNIIKFMKKLQDYRFKYYQLEQELKSENSFDNVVYICKMQNRICEDIARFVLKQTDDCEMIFENILNENTMSLL